MTTASKSVSELLKGKFAAEHAESAQQHVERLIDDFRKGDWEDAIAKGGKFVEAVMKALWVAAGETVPDGRHFSAGSLMDQLPSKTILPDSLRVTIPRACRFVYDIASNRGARHDPTGIDANEMDATAVVSACSWVLAEMIRYSQRDGDPDQAKAIVDGLVRKRFPFFEDIDGRLYTEIGRSALEVGLLILSRAYPLRLSRAELIKSIERHGHGRSNAAVAVSRLLKYADEDDRGGLFLRAVGLRKAEEIIAETSR
jgi:hypothetical protein